MNIKKRLFQEIEQAPDDLAQKVLEFLLITKKKNQKQNTKVDLERQLQEMAEDLEIQAEIASINQEFLTTEMDGLN